MALLDQQKRQENEKLERYKAWQILRKIPEYIQDYELSKSNTSEEFRNEIKERWGFEPLADYKEIEVSFEFMDYFSTYTDEASGLLVGIDWNGLDYFDVNEGKVYDPNGRFYKKLKDFPKKISITVDLNFPLNVLVEDFKNNIQALQTMLEIKPSYSKKHEHIEFLVIQLKKLHRSNTQIVNEITKLSCDKESTVEFKKFIESKIRREIKKLEKV